MHCSDLLKLRRLKLIIHIIIHIHKWYIGDMSQNFVSYHVTSFQLNLVIARIITIFELTIWIFSFHWTIFVNASRMTSSRVVFGQYQGADEVAMESVEAEQPVWSSEVACPLWEALFSLAASQEASREGFFACLEEVRRRQYLSSAQIASSVFAWYKQTNVQTGGWTGWTFRLCLMMRDIER